MVGSLKAGFAIATLALMMLAPTAASASVVERTSDIESTNQMCGLLNVVCASASISGSIGSCSYDSFFNIETCSYSFSWSCTGSGGANGFVFCQATAASGGYASTCSYAVGGCTTQDGTGVQTISYSGCARPTATGTVTSTATVLLIFSASETKTASITFPLKPGC